jgi:predicted nucleotidyltransferase
MIVHDGSGHLEEVKLTLSGMACQMMLEVRQSLEKMRKTMRSTDLDKIVALVHKYHELKYASHCNRASLRERYEAVVDFEPENEMETIMRTASIEVLKELGDRFRLTQDS